MVCAFVALSASVDSHSVRLDGEEEEVAGFSVVSLYFSLLFLFCFLVGRFYEAC